jgi:hypothetical protein
MQKLMKNWVFTLVTCALLAALSVLMFLDGFDVGGLYIAERVLHLMAAVALSLYVAFALFPLTARYKGKLRIFVLGEIAILLFTAFAHLCMEWMTLPLISSLEVCAVVGLAIWLRGAVGTVQAYLSAASDDPKARIPLWRLLLCILLCAVGVWQVVDPLFSDDAFVFVIATVAAVMAILFAFLTISNHKAGAATRNEKKKAKQAKKAEQKAEEEKNLLPAATTEK